MSLLYYVYLEGHQLIIPTEETSFELSVIAFGDHRALQLAAFGQDGWHVTQLLRRSWTGHHSQSGAEFWANISSKTQIPVLTFHSHFL